MMKKKSQNREFIYILLFKTMEIVASFFIFHSYECQRIQTKIHFIKFEVEVSI
jgi:hypothetical protein